MKNNDNMPRITREIGQFVDPKPIDQPPDILVSVSKRTLASSGLLNLIRGSAPNPQGVIPAPSSD